MPPSQLPKLNNGHKTLNAAEAKALQELLKSEKDRRLYFEENKHKMVRSRNPLTGEATPRDGMGEPIINPNWVNREITSYRKKEKELTEKIGVKTERYNCLGNLATTTTTNQQQNNESVVGFSSRFPPPSSRMGLDSKQVNRPLLTQQSSRPIVA